MRMWRAYQPWPGVWIEIPGSVGRVILSNVSLMEEDLSIPPGHLVVREGALLLGLAGGALNLERVTPAGGTNMTGEAFARGRKDELAAHGRISE